MKRALNWTAIYLCWLTENLKRDRTTPYTLEDVAKKFGAAYKTVRTHAGKEKWNQKLQAKIIQQNQEVLYTVQEQEVLSEVEIRIRQAQISRQLLDKGMRKLDLVPIEELTVRQAIALVKLGLLEERKALGLADKYEVTNIQDNSGGEYISVEERKLRIKQADTLANQLFEYLKSHTSSIDQK